ncbi:MULTISPECIES: sulfur carrier protein ThiS [Ochrobactrum]|uniref:Sulfur carrier protein ThiS n=2 Tax=Ochrobactrum TaxID=528 RepID=A0ABY2Y7F6_9HYPH|nr:MULTISPECIES: sulfur carrier protein ThiS [Brucella]MCI0999599.1 sulfur carrier protein ThiS [Ochrobactrum sp. C6C9]NNU58905.1 sulfur carrier protein ThiS [[Ochrobactrum] soli]RLL75239.1 sulfur carrier protein ThiS [[Ochrobactrum] soli]TNV16956.1 sulfur carrier protein ThiS [[Ochrobactrum] teleogrylli]
MTIVLNGEVITTAAANLAALLAEIELDEAVVATALNGEFVASDERSTATLSSGDRIEVLAPMQGG